MLSLMDGIDIRDVSQYCMVVIDFVLLKSICVLSFVAYLHTLMKFITVYKVTCDLE
jgi:hypothetical protein